MKKSAGAKKIQFGTGSARLPFNETDMDLFLSSFFDQYVLPAILNRTFFFRVYWRKKKISSLVDAHNIPDQFVEAYMRINEKLKSCC